MPVPTSDSERAAAPWRRRLALAATLVPITFLAGCAALGFLSNVALTEETPAAHTLAQRPTLVLVDDPTGVLGDPALASVTAAKVGFNLTQRRLVPAVTDLGRLGQLASEIGQDFPRMPVDEIGRRLGAEQVIHVHVDSAALAREPGMFLPTALAYVKVIDARTGQRLFPAGDSATATEPGSAPGPPVGARGHPVRSIMQYKSAGDRDPNALVLTLRRQLAQRIGRDVGRLFYKHPTARTSLADDEQQ